MQKTNGAPDEDGAPGNECNDDHSTLYASSGDRATKRLKRSASKSLRRSVKRKRRTPTKTVTRELAVYSGQTLLGAVKLGAKATAYDSHNTRIGVFDTLANATAALHALNSGVEKGRPHE
jgi:hypothetical protein